MTTETRFRPDRGRGDKLMYHARMFAFAMLAGVALFLALVGGFVICAWLEIIHIEDR